MTSFIRTVLTEAMVKHTDAGYKILSCTTDGFLLHAAGEAYVLESVAKGEFGEVYQTALANLGISNYYLEQKHYDGTGVLTWKTRGQLSLTGAIKAMTGYSVRNQPKSELIAQAKERVLGVSKVLTFVQERLRSGKDILKKGGSVTPTFTEMRYSFESDSKRLYTNQGGNESYCMSAPTKSVEQSEFLSLVSSFGKRKWTKSAPLANPTGGKRDDSYVRLFVRQLIRSMFSNEEVFGKLDRQAIHTFLTSIGVSVSLNYISQQKANVFTPYTVYQTGKTRELMAIVKEYFIKLDEQKY